jgi:hypothetical protein
MSGSLDVPRSTCHPARHLASTARAEGIRRTQQQSVPPQVPQVGHAGGETGASPSIGGRCWVQRRPDAAKKLEP